MTEITEIKMDEVPPTWLFDGVCVLCNGAVQYTLKHEKEPLIQFVSIQSAEGRQLAAQNGFNPDDAQSFLFIENGEAPSKSDAVIALARHVDGPAGLIPLLRFLPKFLRDFGYDRIARNRYRLFGCKSECPVPYVGIRHRFVL